MIQPISTWIPILVKILPRVTVYLLLKQFKINKNGLRHILQSGHNTKFMVFEKCNINSEDLVLSSEIEYKMLFLSFKNWGGEQMSDWKN